MKTIHRIELASDLLSLASGQVPTSMAFRLIPLFFHRKKGLTKAQLKKLIMQRRRRFVDNVVMIHERRLHKKNFEEKIDQTKNKLIKKPSKNLPKPSSAPKLRQDKNRSPDNRWQNKASPKQGEHRTKIQGLVDDEKLKVRSRWAVRVNAKNGNSKEI